ncbi:hypothetical protein QQ045_005321 [Rhodiola kirilowii]
MGPLNTNYQAEPAAAGAINHFAHHHPLHVSHHHHKQTPCSACSHPTSAPAYGCQHCNFYLHISCANMPQQLKHPFDSNKTHALTLLPKPVYPEGRFSCDACGHQGTGFSYHCSDCRIDLHILCAGLPTVASVSSHHHQLSLVFAPPYENNQFGCDVCGKAGSKTWLYHCGTCSYDVHLGCARGAQKPVVRSVTSHQQQQPKAAFNQGQQVISHSSYQQQPNTFNHQGVQVVRQSSHQQPNAAFNQEQVMRQSTYQQPNTFNQEQQVIQQSSYQQPNAAFNQGQGQPVMGQPANPMPYRPPAPVPARRCPQIGNAIVQGAAEGIASAVAQNVTNMIMGGGGAVEDGSGGGDLYAYWFGE